MTMMEVRWKSPERELPALGVARPGEVLLLPSEVAQKYIAQGDAEEAHAQKPTRAQPKTSKEENDQ